MGALGTSPADVDLLIEHAAILPMVNAPAASLTMAGPDSILYDGSLAIDGGRIVDLASADQLAGRYAATRTVDARGTAVLPGLIDTHHHFLQNFLKGSRDDLPFADWIAQISSPLIGMAVRDYLDGDAELQRQATRLGCTEALLSGITCIVNMEWATAPEVIDVYEEAGIRAIHVLTLTDLDQWDSPGMLLSLDGALALAEQLVARCSASQGGRVQFRYGPACENSASADLFRQVRQLADHHRVGIHFHLAESEIGWQNIQRRYGKTPVRYLHDLGLLGPDVLAAHCIWLSDEDIHLLKETGTSVSYNPECHMKLALGIAPVYKMLEAGVVVALGTDTCAVNDNMDLFEAMRVGAFLQKVSTMEPDVLPAYQALEMATLGGARALGLGDSLGSLEVGKKADLILVDLEGVHMRPINHLVNNLVYCASAAHDVKMVVVDGRIVVEDGALTAWDAPQAVAEAEAYAHRRFRDAGLAVSPWYRR
jgi:5-methylthioadenosine/S-adenosylhomocysteine deaminase